MRPILVQDVASSTIAIYGLTPFSYTRLGNTFSGSLVNSTNASALLKKGCTVQYADTLYTFNYNNILRLNRSTGNWDVLATVTGHYSADSTHMRANTMHLAYVGGEYYLVMYYWGSTSSLSGTTVRGAVYNLRTNVLTVSGAEVSLGATSVATSMAGHSAVFGSNLYGQFSPTTTSTASNQMCILSIPGAVISNLLTGTAAPGNTVYFVNYKNELYRVSGSTTLALYRYVGGAWSLAVTLTGTYKNDANYKASAFVYGANLYVLGMLSTNVWKVWKWDGTTATDVTTATIGTLFNSTGTGGFRPTIDQHSDPTNPIVYLLFTGAFTSGSTWAFYKWMGESTAVEYVGIQGNSYGIVENAAQETGGGELSYALNEPNIQIFGDIEAGTSLGNSKLSFRLYESNTFPSGSAVEVKFFSCPSSESYPDTAMRLINPSTGSVFNSYTIQGMTTGSGNLHTVEWRAAADGFSAGDGVRFMGSVSGVI